MKFHIFTQAPRFLTDPEDDPSYQETLTAEDHKSAAEAAEGPTMLGASMYLWVLADGDLPWGAERYVVWLATRASLEYAPENKRTLAPAPILWG